MGIEVDCNMELKNHYGLKRLRFVYKKNNGRKIVHLTGNALWIF